MERAMKFRTMFLALAFACIGTAALAIEEGQIWQGAYHYPNAPSVQFVFFVTGATSAQFEGVIVENNTLGNPNAPLLYGNVYGQVNRDGIAFEKTYDGTGGVSHTLQYTGVLGQGYDRFSGTWTNGTNTGTFEMQLRGQ